MSLLGRARPGFSMRPSQLVQCLNTKGDIVIRPVMLGEQHGGIVSPIADQTRIPFEEPGRSADLAPTICVTKLTSCRRAA